MKRETETRQNSAIEEALRPSGGDAGAQRTAAEHGEANGAAADNQRDDRFDALVDELHRLMQSDRVPEGFDLRSACTDAAFLQLTQEMPMEAAMRVYAAERRAAEADTRAKERLALQMQSRSALPQAVRGTAGAPVERDYASMSSADFRALEQQFKRAAQRGVRIRL